MKMGQLANASINMCIPMSVVRALNANNATALYDEDIAVAKSSVDLLVCMLRKAVGFYNVVCRWASQKTISYAQSTAFHSTVSKSILAVRFQLYLVYFIFTPMYSVEFVP